MKLAWSNGKGAFTLKPDITILENDEVKLILDAKYKNPDKGIFQSDVYQMLAYALRYKCRRLFLVYPAFHRLLKPMEIINTYTIPTEVGDLELSSIQIDLREKDVGLIQREFGWLIDRMLITTSKESD
jgi:5-methylcytosine-specific restriction enzyme subunit McrC